MSRVLVGYGSKHGATAEIAEAVADELRQTGHEVDCLPAEKVTGVDAYDAAVIGSAVYMKRWRPEARRLLKRHAKALADRPFWVFSSGPFGEKPDPSWSEPTRTIELAERLGVRDHVVFGGRLPARAEQLHGARDGPRLPARQTRPARLGRNPGLGQRIGTELSSGISHPVESFRR